LQAQLSRSSILSRSSQRLIHHFFLQQSHLSSCNLNDDSGTIESLTRSWATRIPILPPSSRYALICEKCFAHNGLVKENMWADAQYICPKCNHFNASTRSKRSRQKQNASPTSPNASATSSPLTPTSGTRQPSLPQSPQESDLPNVDHMEVDTEVDAST